MASVLAAASLTACAGGVEVSTTSGTSTSTSSSSGSGSGAGGVGGAPVGPDSFVRFSEGLAWCAVRASGKVVCWDSVLGVNPPPQGELNVIAGIDDATAASVEFYSACVHRASGQVACWGTNEGGELLSLPPGGGEIATPTDLPGIDALAVTSSIHATCVLRPGGQVTCSGGDSGGPMDVPGLNDATGISGAGAGCAVRASGQVACWEGIGATPDPVAFLDDATEVSVSEQNACALHASGEVSCWSLSTPPAALKVPGFAHAIRVRTGAQEVCAIDQAHDVWCWPWDWSQPATPTDLHGVRDLGFNYADRCVILTSGELSCGKASGS